MALAADQPASLPWRAISLKQLPAVAALAGLIAGGVARLASSPDIAHALWSAATLVVLAFLLVEIVTSLRRGSVGLDLVAALSMAAAVTFGQSLAGNVVALMYAGGTLLENFAEGRARSEMMALLGRVARTAMLNRGGQLVETPIEAIRPDDRLLIRQGEVVPVDGTVAGESALLDQSALTGEGLPVQRRRGEDVMSGSTNVGDAFDLLATRLAAESTYAGVVRLVEHAQAAKAPAVRMADRFALWFLALTLLIAGGAWWFTGDHIRALAVLVIATPCPLILAVPVAIISSLSRAARLGVLVKSGGAMEQLAIVDTAILDKTGTLTEGRASVAEIRTAPGIAEMEMLRLAASLDQASGHVIAKALVDAAADRGLVLSQPADVSEAAGTGIAGRVDGRRVVVGGSRYVAAQSERGDPYAFHDGSTPGMATVAVAIDGAVAGLIVLKDPLRTDAALSLASLRQAGVRRLILASGDRAEVVDSVASTLGFDMVRGELRPEDKIALVGSEKAARHSVMMVGDGVNDAPALAAADVGVAMGARGSAASSEAASVVLLTDQLDRLVLAVKLARRTRRIALESVGAGLGLSIAGMLAAAFGYLPPIAGALGQEVIDLAVILNALRALR
jgi:heavy metal translocating P-type ATPase